MAELDKLQVVDEWITHKFWIGQIEGVVRVTGLSIKCEVGQVLAIVKGISAEGPRVAFLQARGLSHLYALLGRGDVGGVLKWREDKFALDKMTKSE